VIVLGVDPGIFGGLVILGSDGTEFSLLVDAIDIPTIDTDAGGSADVALVRDWIPLHRPTFALIECAQAMPSLGASWIQIRPDPDAIVLSAVPIEIGEHSGWKNHFCLSGKDKKRTRQRALELFPGSHGLLACKRDHGRAEAALIALYGLKNSRVIAAPPGAEPGLISETLIER
jgi:crossover junction endodeoxyribonuclease RuvC